MSDAAKLVEKMKNRPNGIRFQEAENVLNAYGYVLKRRKGSHRIYISDSGDVMTIPEKTPVKRVYVEEILKRIGEN
jgi:predicted RNA binding protein YcfA (HicA-like mRNA interferase family)